MDRFELRRRRVPAGIAACLVLAAMGPEPLQAQECPGPFTLQNYTGTQSVGCPCFITGEEAGVILAAPNEHYPIEITRISITWASQFGGAPQSLEQAVHLYEGALPDPGVPIFSLVGPQLTDGFINQFDISPIPGDKTIASGPFTVTLEFFNSNSGNFFAPSVVHDGNGCQAGKNVVKAIPGGWNDACVLGVTGDWVMSVEYTCDATTDTQTLTSAVGILGVSPNPLVGASQIAFAVRQAGVARLAVYDVRGRVVRTLADRRYDAGPHLVTWSGEDATGTRVSPGTYFLRLEAGRESFTRKIVLR